jgi:hypothetical protein
MFKGRLISLRHTNLATTLITSRASSDERFERPNCSLACYDPSARADTEQPTIFEGLKESRASNGFLLHLEMAFHAHRKVLQICNLAIATSPPRDSRDSFPRHNGMIRHGCGDPATHCFAQCYSSQ